MAFSNIQEGQKLNIINIAIVENEELKSSEYYKKAFDNLSDEKNEDRLFNISYVNEEEAKEKLQNDEIAGYMKLEDGKPKLTFVSNGIDQTVFKYITEQIMYNCCNYTYNYELLNLTFFIQNSIRSNFISCSIYNPIIIRSH